jgi:hypothetical protein
VPVLTGPLESRDAARKRVFFQLDSERRSLAARPGPRWRPSRRYEDLSLAAMLARLERGWLAGRTDGSLVDREAGDERPAYGLAEWADPWGVAPRMKLNADLEHLDEAMAKLGRWLPRGAVAKAHDRAHRRLDAITATLLRRDPRALAAPGVAASAAEEVRELGHPARKRLAALGALLLLAAGVGGWLLLSTTAEGPSDRPDAPRIAQAGRDRPEAPRPSRPPGRERRGAIGGEGQSRESRSASTDAAGLEGASASAPSATPAPTPTAVEAPAPPPSAPVTAPPPAPAATPPQSTPAPSSSARGAEASPGCPPEFGYEC